MTQTFAARRSRRQATAEVTVFHAPSRLEVFNLHTARNCVYFRGKIRLCGDQPVDNPARRRGEKQIVIRAGDIHKDMGYQSRMPLVCAALGAKKFEEFAGVERISLTGPTNGANAIFTFRII